MLDRHLGRVFSFLLLGMRLLFDFKESLDIELSGDSKIHVHLHHRVKIAKQMVVNFNLLLRLVYCVQNK